MKKLTLSLLALIISTNIYAANSPETQQKTESVGKQTHTHKKVEKRKIVKTTISKDSNRVCLYKDNGDYRCKGDYSSSLKETTGSAKNKQKVIYTPNKKHSNKAKTTALKNPKPIVITQATDSQYIFSDYRLNQVINKNIFIYNKKVKFKDSGLPESQKYISAYNISADLSANEFIDYENEKSMVKIAINTKTNKITNLTKIQIFNNVDECLAESDKHYAAYSKIQTKYHYSTNCYSRDNESFVMKLEGNI